MSTIASTPPSPSTVPAAANPAPVKGPTAVERTKERPPRRHDSGAPGDGNQANGNQAPEDLSDELLLKVVRAIGGERGVIVDRKV